MDKKLLTWVFLIALIIVAVILLISKLDTDYHIENISGKYSNLVVEKNRIKVDIEGYRQACNDQPTISVYDGSNWRTVTTRLPLDGMYFLDGRYIGHGMCDLWVGYKIIHPVEISLVEYVEVGQKESLETKGYQVPEYITRNLTGKIRVELGYYNDSNCQNKKIFNITINN